MLALITGSAGFAGTHLIELLQAQSIRCEGFDLATGHDVRDYEVIRAAVEFWHPDMIFHLAAQAYVAESLSDPRRAFEVNTLGTVNVLDAVRQTGSHARVLIAGTSQEYGHQQSVITEDTPLLPTAPYGASKAGASMAAQAYARAFGIPVIITRAFNHTGPGQSPSYAVSAFARRVAMVEAGHAEAVEHGDLSGWRDISDVRDVVRAYWLAILADPGVYNVCSGRTVTMGEVLGVLIELAKVPIPLISDAKLHRPDVSERFMAGHHELEDATGWRPLFTLDQTLRDLLDYWRARV